MGYCTHESRLVLRSAEIQPLIPRFVRFSLFDLYRLRFKSAPPITQPPIITPPPAFGYNNPGVGSHYTTA
jgi:hypothetical protein